MAQPTRATAAIFVGALALRMLYVVSIRHAPFFDHLQTEALHYHQWASLILAGHAPSAPFEQSPGYPYFVAAVYTLFAPSATAVAISQAVLDAATCALITLIGAKWFGVRAGLIAGTLAAVYGPLVYFVGELLPSTLFIFASVAAVAAGAFGAATLAGCLWAAALYVRSEIVLAVPFVLFGAWMRGRRRAVLKTVIPLLTAFAILVSVNAAGSGQFVPFTTSAGVNLWLGNNPYADGVNPFVHGPLQRVEGEVRATALTGVDADRLFRRRAVSFIRQSPGHALRLAWKKFLWTINDRELPNNDDIEWVTAQSWIFWPPVFPLSFGLLLPFACAGAVWLGPQWRKYAPLGGLLFTGLATGIVFFTNARFRLILVPSMLLLAAVALDRFPGMLAARHQNRRALLGAAAAFAVGLTVAWGNFYGIRSYRISELTVNVGILEREVGRFDSAVAHLREGLAGNPDDGVAWIHLALALEQQGNIDGARETYRAAQARLPNDPEVQQMAARFFQRHP